MSYAMIYKPKKFSDIVIYDKYTMDKLDSYIYTENMQPLILHGKYGVGKTLISELLPDAIERGVANVRKIDAAEFRTLGDVQATFGSSNRFYELLASREYIVSNEINFTKNAAEAFRDEMDKLQKYVQFIFTTNDIDRMDGGIVDRCSVLEIGVATAADWLPRAKGILAQEAVIIPDDELLLFLDAKLKHEASHRKLLEALGDFVFQFNKKTKSAAKRLVQSANVIQMPIGRPIITTP